MNKLDQKYFVGIDWATTKHDIYIIDENDNKIDYFIIDHNNLGFEKLTFKLDELSPQKNDFAIGIESSTNLISHYMVEKGYYIYYVRPSSVAERRKADYPSGIVKDEIDAFIIANLLKTNRKTFRRINKDSEYDIKFRIISRTHTRLVRHKVEIVNRLTATLNSYYPAFNHIFPDIQSHVAIRILKKYPSFSLLKYISKEELLAIAGIGNIKADRLIQKLNVSQIIVAKGVEMANRRYVNILAEQLSLHLTEIKSIEKELSKLYERHPFYEIYKSLPSSNGTSLMKIASEISTNFSKYETYKDLQCDAGTCPVTESSGHKKTSKYFVKFRHACNKYLRKYFQDYSIATTASSYWSSNYYNHAKNKHEYHRAIRSLANIWVKIIFTMLRKNEPYNENKFLKKQFAA